MFVVVMVVVVAVLTGVVLTGVVMLMRVPRKDLRAQLLELRHRGYTLLGVEQTHTSVPLDQRLGCTDMLSGLLANWFKETCLFEGTLFGGEETEEKQIIQGFPHLETSSEHMDTPIVTKAIVPVELSKWALGRDRFSQ
ncbi:unnamed protein product [Effrenium voratum]|nr:unnamed protein product [Effrenium voratum]